MTPKEAVIRAILVWVILSVIAITVVIFINSFIFSRILLILIGGGCWTLLYLLRSKSDYKALSLMNETMTKTPCLWTAIAGKTMLLSQYTKLAFDGIVVYQYKITDVTIENSTSNFKNRGSYTDYSTYFSLRNEV